MAFGPRRPERKPSFNSTAFVDGSARWCCNRVKSRCACTSVPFKGSKQLRDTAAGVRIEFLVSGQFPGDGKPKPVAFPDPSGGTIEMNGIPVLRLPELVELKL